MKQFYFILYLVSSAVWAQVDCSLTTIQGTALNFDATFNAISGNYNASTSITSIDEISNTNYLAPEITLNDGFKATADSSVLISVENCLGCNGTLDLYIADNVGDVGDQPNTSTTIAWDSPNIWNSNTMGGTVHENPVYNANPSVFSYIYVKVTNKSCVTSGANNVVKVYVNMPSSSINTNSIETADARVLNPTLLNNNSNGMVGTRFVKTLIGTKTIPAIAENDSVIIEFPWKVPNPNLAVDCITFIDQYNSLIYAKIVSALDPITVAETNNDLNNILNNNNIAGKNNVLISNVSPITYPVTASDSYTVNTIITNDSELTKRFEIKLFKDNLEQGNPIYSEAEVSLKLDDVLLASWENGGSISTNTQSTNEIEKRYVSNNNAIISNIDLLPYQAGNLEVKINFLISELSLKENFKYHLLIKDMINNEIVGGNTFEIKKNNRPPFEADAEDLIIDKFDDITLTAEEIGEQAIYNWYDSEGNLLFEGKDLQIANAVAEKYKLEVISSVDGYKDYTDVEVKLKPSRLISMSPNPTYTSKATVYYKINEANSAYIMVTNYYMSPNGISRNYIVDVNATEKFIDISNYPKGFYKITLVVDGVVMDVKILSTL